MLENNDFVPLFKITRHHRMKCVLLKELTALMIGRVSNEEMVLCWCLTVSIKSDISGVIGAGRWSQKQHLYTTPYT